MFNTNSYPFRSIQSHSFSGEVDTAWVRHYASGLTHSHDVAYAIAVDNAGNVYVTGDSDNLPFGIDFFTAKYDTRGMQLWAARYGVGKGYDHARDIAVDGSGNVYVSGWTYGAGINIDYITIKYSSSGVEQWVRRYNGPGNSDDYANKLAVDDSGNVYVTGSSIGSNTSFDYATIKYDRSGVEQWAARYNGPGIGNDDIEYANALAVDDFGNVYVAGGSFGAGTFSDYATIKYSSSGVEQWVARYNGPGNHTDITTAVAIDTFGNIYVTGRSDGLGSSFDYATIKYNTDGVEQWVTRYNSPRNSSDEATALAIDGFENVYVTGWSYGTDSFYDYVTVKYNSSGLEQWMMSYNGPRNSDDHVNDLIVDSDGNVYVTGSINGIGNNTDYATIKYNSLGVEQWVTHYNGPNNAFDYATAIASDSFGNVYVTGESDGLNIDRDYATIKYSSKGHEEWVARYNGSGNSEDVASALAVDNAGNVYVTGGSYKTNTSDDYATIQYNPSGVAQWTVRYDGPGKSLDYARAVACDRFGNVYVTGESYSSKLDRDYATVKYNSSGLEQWVVRYNGPGNSDDVAVALAVDNIANVYVTGVSFGSSTSNDYATIKYSASGVEQWVVRYNGPGNFDDRASAIAVDALGDVYVTGSSVGSGTGYDYATIKYNSLGSEQWAKRYNGSGNFSDLAEALAADDLGYVYVTGGSLGSGTSYDFATIKYNPSGAEQWIRRYSGPGISSDSATALAVDGSGNVYVTGQGMAAGTRTDYVTVKYNSTGVQQWVASYNGPANGLDKAIALAVDGSENVYVTGWSSPSAIYPYIYYYDYATVKYNSSGTQVWVARYNGPENSYDEVRSLVVDGSGNVYVTGYSGGPGQSIYATIKYVQTAVSVKGKQPNKPSTYWLSQNFPNPFNPSTTIRYTLAKHDHVTLKVFNLQGQEIATLVNENKLAGEYEIQWNPTDVPSGVYVYRLQAGEFMETRKLILLR